MLARPFPVICAVLLICNSAVARAVHPWTIEELNSEADVVVITTVVSTEPFDELLEIDRRHPKSQQRDGGLSIFDNGWRDLDGQLTTFALKTVLKGTVEGESLQLVHYKVDDGAPGKYQNRALVAEFRKEEYRADKASQPGVPKQRVPTGRKQSYLLFLKLRKDGKFEPVSGQIDSAFSVMELRGSLPYPE
jgi:hypothetical protein